MERRVQGTLGELENVVGDLLNPLGNGVAVYRSQIDDLQDEHVERALGELRSLLHCDTMFSDISMSDMYSVIGNLLSNGGALRSPEDRARSHGSRTTRGQVFGLVVGQGLALGISGILAACVIALLLIRWIPSILVDTKPTDPLTCVGTTTGFLLIAALASWLPARRAALVDPMQAGRSE
jgi:hypothetical protein